MRSNQQTDRPAAAGTRQPPPGAPRRFRLVLLSALLLAGVAALLALLPQAWSGPLLALLGAVALLTGLGLALRARSQVAALALERERLGSWERDRLSGSHQLLRSVVDNLPCLLTVYDERGRLLFHNADFKRQFQLPERLCVSGRTRFEDLIDFCWRRGDYGRGAAADATARRYLAYASDPQPLTFELTGPNGLDVQANAAPLPGGGFIYVGLDISERRRGERLLRDAMDAIGEAFVLFDPDDRLLLFNENYRALFPGHEKVLRRGASFEQTVRAKLAADPGHEAHGRVEAWVAERIAAHRHGDSTLVQHTGTGRWVRVMDKRLPDGHTASFRIDITDLVEAARSAEKASLAKSEFLANMSHEIRTPMNAVLGMLTLLQRTRMDAAQRDYVSKTEGAARSLLGLLNDILDFSKVEAGKMSLDPQPIRIDALLRDLSVILAANIGQREIEVLFDVDPQAPRGVVADPLRLQQVLINLAGNALKFTEAGEVLVQLKLVALHDGAVTLDFAVSDTGIGIAPEQQQRIFSGFAQAEASTTRRYGGTGLGLAISQRLLRLMGSELQLHSTPGHGSRFFFRLHLPLPAQQPPRLPEPGLGMVTRVLVVDDNAHARELEAAMCASLGWIPDTAPSGRAALERVRAAIAAGNDYQVAIVDDAMPEMDGWATCRAIRTLTFGRSAPVLVMVSGHGRDLLQGRSQRERALIDAFLDKPVTASMLYDAVADARAVGPQTDFDRMHEALSAAGDEAGGALPGGAAPELPRRPVGPPRLAGMRLLLVEDNPNNQQVARELLEDEGAEVLVAGDGAQALRQLAQQQQQQQLQQQARPIDAVLMDVQMPVMDGFTATRLIRRQLRLTLPIIAMTANARASDRQACLDAGMSEHVGKPFDLDRLVAVLHAACGREAGPVPQRAGRDSALPSLHLQALADAAGIALHDALARMSGKRALFVRTVDALMRAAWSLSAPPGAGALHGLRGLAGALGCTELAELCGQGQRALESGAGLAPGWQARFEGALERHLIALVEIAAALPDDDAAPDGAEPDQPQPLAPELQLLVELLEGADMAALDAFTRLRARLRAKRPDSEAQIGERIAVLDFAGAAGQCRALLHDLQRNF